MNLSSRFSERAPLRRAVLRRMRNTGFGFLALAVAIAADAGERSTIDAVQFYNPIEQPVQRLDDPESLMHYIVALNASLGVFLEEHACNEPATVEIVAGLPPEGDHRIWLMKWNTSLEAPQEDALVRQLEAVPAPKPHGGPIAFVLKISLNGASADETMPGAPELPQEWKDALKGMGSVIVPDGLPTVIWRLKPSSRPTAGKSAGNTTSASPQEPPPVHEFHMPPGYDVQDLGSAGGQVLVPRGWYFRVTGAPNGPVYTISKEDSSQGSYDTGLRIQLIGKIKATTGLTAREAVRINVERKKSLEQVINECPEEDLGLFRRLCLETLGYPSKSRPKQQFHMIYSFWWNDEMDIMAAGTFGAPCDEWLEAEKIYAVIRDFKLIDRERASGTNRAAPGTRQERLSAQSEAPPHATGDTASDDQGTKN